MVHAGPQQPSVKPTRVAAASLQSRRVLSRDKGKAALSGEPRGPPRGCLPKQSPSVRNEDGDHHEHLLVLGRV